MRTTRGPRRSPCRSRRGRRRRRRARRVCSPGQDVRCRTPGMRARRRRCSRHEDRSPLRPLGGGLSPHSKGWDITALYYILSPVTVTAGRGMDVRRAYPRAGGRSPISGIRFGRRFIYALGLIKKAAAETHMEIGLLDAKLGKAIVKAADEVMEGKARSPPPLPPFPT